MILLEYTIIQNNAANIYGTAVLVKSDFSVDNIKKDTLGLAIVYDINNVSFDNLYLHSGTDGLTRNNREDFISEIIPQLLVNVKDAGEIGSDLNCVTTKEDCTKNPESKFSQSMKRVIQTFNLKDSFRALHPSDRIFSRYNRRQGQEGASRIDWSYHLGAVTRVSAWYESVE